MFKQPSLLTSCLYTIEGMDEPLPNLPSASAAGFSGRSYERLKALTKRRRGRNVSRINDSTILPDAALHSLWTPQDLTPLPLSGKLLLTIKSATEMKRLDVIKIMRELHLMRLELESALDSSDDVLLSRHGSVRGRKMHVYNTIRMMRMRSQWKRDYIQEEANKIVVYITSCGVVHSVFDKCKETINLLRALRIKAEFRDLYLDPTFADELVDRMGLSPADKELVYDSLPVVYVNGRYFGNDVTLFLENENNNLVDILRDFQGRNDCSMCNGSGFVVCSYCRGGKKVRETFRVRLRCSHCDRNGIAPCPRCAPCRS
ncbi:unnamed protein product [Cylicocyclus nassatus]|uniref:Glutaredoxin domain-containing protein n=1 Tax=Cylicocyclus nassatus TaxID=53992 RepID=A0AA36GSN0_CYLNA|nr:unnamed protein product [Cylicocyclus nassatus]